MSTTFTPTSPREIARARMELSRYPWNSPGKRVRIVTVIG
jgi:hypothetical protein